MAKKNSATGAADGEAKETFKVPAVPPFPDMQNLNAKTADEAGPDDSATGAADGEARPCVCITKHFRRGELIMPGTVRDFAGPVPEHFEEL